MRDSLQSLARDTVTVGTAATAATTVAALCLGRQRDESAWAPLNAVSHIAFGDEAAEHTELSAKYTATGASLNAAAMMSWAAIYAGGMRLLPRRSWPAAITAGVAVSALAYVTDYHVVPRRLTPGFEKRLDNRSLFWIYATLAAGLAAGWSMRSRTAPPAPLRVVRNLNPARYAGRWFEIARLPNRFEDQCAGDVTAEYTVRPEGGLTVVNRCRRRDGKMMDATGVARVVRGAPPSVLQVRFAPAALGVVPFVWGDYQVMALDDAHTYSLVGTPDREYLWILSRTPRMDPGLLRRLLAIAGEQGFDVTRVVKTPHSR